MSKSAKLTALIFSNASVLSQLGRSPLKDGLGKMLVELSLEPHLAYALGMDTPGEFPGLPGILYDKIGLTDLEVVPVDLSLPFVLAPGRRSSRKAMVDAVGRLADDASAPPATLLAHASDLDLLKGVIPYIDGLSVTWDLGDPPAEALVELGTFLGDEEKLSPSFWNGFHPYSTPERPATDATKDLLAGIFEKFQAA